jgi:hypothetical protein
MSVQPPPPATGSFKAAPIGNAASVLVWAVALGSVLVAASDWRTYAKFKDDLRGYDASALDATDAFYIIATVAAGVVYVVWLYQVRRNAERFTKAPHRRARNWLIWGWLCPILNLWFPKQIVDDIVAASLPQTDPHADELPRRRLRVVQVWWISYVASTLISFADPGTVSDPSSGGDLLWTTTLSIANAVLTIISAVYAVRVIRLINNLQASRPWVAWWDTAASTS